MILFRKSFIFWLMSWRQRLDTHTKMKYKMKENANIFGGLARPTPTNPRREVRHAGVEYAESKDQVNIGYYILHMSAYLSPKTKRSR